jgi:hypothetical protein
LIYSGRCCHQAMPHSIAPKPLGAIRVREGFENDIRVRFPSTPSSGRNGCRYQPHIKIPVFKYPSFPTPWDSFENDLMDTHTPTYDIDTDAFHPHNYIHLPSLSILFSCIGRNLPRRADLSTSTNHSRSNIATPFLVFWANTGYNLSGIGAQPYFHATDC